jgi:oligoendopeptidase F
MKNYFSLLKKETGINDFSFYDTYISISSLDKKFDYETQKEIIKDALSVLGEEYQQLLQEAYDQRWIDVYPSDNKASGGYQYGSYDTHPYVFLNNTDDYHSLSTMAHELGHAMHSYYSHKYQPSQTAGYSIFVAEVASTVNEILLNRHMIKNSKNIDDKIFFIDQYIKSVKGTVFRQTMFSEFEEKLHNLTQNKETLTLERINEEYKKVLEKHFDGVVNIDENINHEWIAISHFYRPFYVYKYATSFTTANYIASSILEDKNNMKEKYFELLKSGGSDWPNEILKKVGVDLETSKPYEMLFEDLNNSIEELKRLLELKKQENKQQSR